MLPGEHPPTVALDGAEGVSGGRATVDHRRRGRSNGARVRLWKIELQKFANEAGLQTTVCHFPPRTGKWNKIEHRLLSYISQNWRG
jgi:hypothetical protein